MATIPRHGRKGGKVVSSPALAPRVITPGSAVSPASLQTPGEGTTIISDPNAAHPFDPDAIMSVLKRTTTSEANVLQFDLDAIQHIGKGVMVGRTKQVRTTTRQPHITTMEVMPKLRSALALQQSKSQGVCKRSLQLQKLEGQNVLIARKPHEALVLAVSISTTVEAAKVLVVVPKYFEVCHAKTYLKSLDVGDSNVTVGVFYGQTFDGTRETRLWVTSAEMALLYLTKMQNIAPFTHVVVPVLSDNTHLLSCFVKAFGQWMLNSAAYSKSVQLVVTPVRPDRFEAEGMFGTLKTAFVESDSEEEQQVSMFSYGETCALVGKEMMEMEKDSSGKYPGPTRRLIDHTAEVAAEVVRCIIVGSEVPQIIVIFTAEAREVLTALQDARIEGCAVYSGLKSTEDTAHTRHRVHVMNHVRHALDTDNEYTMVLDMGTIRRPIAQHKSESFMAASTTEWETRAERAERISILGARKEHCYFALYSDDIAAAAFQDDAKSLPDVFSVEDAFLQSARLNLPIGVVTAFLPSIPTEMVEQAMCKLAEKCVIANSHSFAITFFGEMAARLPVELDIACFIIGGCNIGLGEAALAIGSVAALPFRSTTPLTYSSTRWSECTAQSRDKYGGDVAGHSDLLADTLVFIEWLKLRARREPTTGFLETFLLQEFKLEKIEELMNYMREQLTNYAFLERFDTLNLLDSVTSSIKECSTIFLLMMSVTLARRAAFIRDAGHLNEKDRYASMVFVRTSKRVAPHSFIPSSVKWNTGRIIVPVILKNSTTIFSGLFSLIHTPYFFASLLLLYPQVEYSSPAVTDKGRVVYFGVSCNRQMKRFMVMIDEAAQILDFREKVNLALGCMHALRTLPQPVSRTKFALLLKEQNRLLDVDRLQKDIQRQLLELVTNLSVLEHQGSFETFATHCTAPREILPMSNTPATDAAMLQRFADGSLWEMQRCTPNSSTIPTVTSHGVDTKEMNNNAALMGLWKDEDDDDEVEIIQESYFMRHGPLIEDDDDDDD